MFKIFKYLFELFFVLLEPIFERIPEKVLGIFFYALLALGGVMLSAVEVTLFSEVETVAEMVFFFAKCGCYLLSMAFLALFIWILCFQDWEDEGVPQ